jgi:hypothetical protein
MDLIGEFRAHTTVKAVEIIDQYHLERSKDHSMTHSSPFPFSWSTMPGFLENGIVYKLVCKFTGIYIIWNSMQGI